MSMRVTILGCGSSSGIPLIGCQCPTCTSVNPKNTRQRASIHVQSATTSLIFDTSPDLRQQALKNHIKTLDAVIYTHEHADHLHGIDELRNYNYLMDKPIAVYGNKETLHEIHKRFPYVFLPKPEPIWYRPCLEPREIDTQNYSAFTVGDIELQPFLQWHGQHHDNQMGHTLGFRMGNFAYSTDVNQLPEASFERLKGLDVWIVDCLRYHEAPTHAHLELTLSWIESVKPKRAILTHMAHQLEYEELLAKLPAGVEPGYDGMVIEL